MGRHRGPGAVGGGGRIQMLFAAGNPLGLEQQKVMGCCLGPGGRHSGLRRGLPHHFIRGHGWSRFRELGSFHPRGPVASLRF